MSERTPAGDKGTADRIEADDGRYWVRLVTWQALDREGACMRHCVGDGDYDRLVGGEDLVDDAIWSLRDRDGMSILTVRIRIRGLDYAKGPDNHEPGRGASMQVRHLVAAFKAAGHALEICRGTGIVLLEDGRTFRRDRLPPEVQAQREAIPYGRVALGIPRGEIVRGRLIVTHADGTTTDVGQVAIGGASGPGGGGGVNREAAQPAVPDRGIDEYRYRNDPWYRAAVARAAAGPGAPGRLVVEFFGGGMSGAHPGGGGGPGMGRLRSMRSALEHAQVQALQGRVFGPGGVELAIMERAVGHALLGPAPVAIPWSDVVLTEQTIRIGPAPAADGQGPGGGGVSVSIEARWETNALGYQQDLT